MRTVNIHEAKTHLSKLVEAVEKGEEIIVARAGKPVARLAPLEKQMQPRRAGALKGKLWIADDFDDPLPYDLLAAFYGEKD
jgi:prevent-host-death family protein